MDDPASVVQAVPGKDYTVYVYFNEADIMPCIGRGTGSPWICR